MRGLKAAATCASDIDALRINIRTSEQIIEGAYAVPNFPTRQVGSRQVCQVAQYGVFRTNQVVAALSRLCIPKLATFSLSDSVPGENHITALDQPLTEGLIMNLAIRCVATRNQHSRIGILLIIGNVNQSRDINTRETLEQQFFDVKAVHLNSSGNARI